MVDLETIFTVQFPRLKGELRIQDSEFRSHNISPLRRIAKGEEMRNVATRFQDLVVWQKAHQFVLSIYRVSKCFPPEEKFGLTSQIRRAAVSIPANIAEGFKRRGKADKLRFFNIAHASLEECRYYLILSHDLQWPVDDALFALLEEVSRLLTAYSNAFEKGKPSEF